MFQLPRRLLFLLIFLLTCPTPGPGQQPKEQLPVIRDVVELVNVLCTVKDRKGKLINSLKKEDFQILEDGKPQDIRYFTRESELPLTIGLLIDSSVSQHRLIPAEREAGLAFLDTALREKDMSFLISFDTDVDLLQDFTSNRQLLRRALDKIRVNSGGPISGPFPSTRTGGTHLYDALFLAATEKLSQEVGRKTVILITDGEDQGSRETLDQAVEAAQKADVVVYGILLVDYEFYRGRGFMGYGGAGALKKMSEETGGRVIRVDKPQDLRRAFDEIAEELRSQYSLAYTPSNNRRDGSFRKIIVRTPTKTCACSRARDTTPSRPAGTKRNTGGWMNALLTLILLMAAADPVTHIPAKDVTAALDKPLAPIAQGEKHSVLALRRTSPGQSEVHEKDTDVFYVIDGAATFVTGGSVVAGKTTAPGEIRGTGIRDGQSRRIAKGDVVTISNGTPHWFKDVEGSVTYLVVKVR